MGEIIEKKRIVWIDQLRGLAFFLVILGHVGIDKSTQSLIYSFHMPLFFIISGITISQSKLIHSTYLQLVKKAFKQLLIPCFWMQFLILPLWLVYYRVLNHSTTSVKEVLIGILYENSAVYKNPSSNLWFVIALFFANLLFASIYKLSKGNYQIITLFVISCAILGYTEKGINLPWRINVALTAVVFLYIGHIFMVLLPRFSTIFNKLHILTKILIYISLPLVGWCLWKENGRVSFNVNKFGHSLILFYLTALVFSLFVILIVMKLPHIKPLQYIGQNTFLYLSIHFIVIQFLKYLFPKVFAGYPKYLILALVVYFGLMPLCAIVNRCFPYIVGKGVYNSGALMKSGQYCAVYAALIVPFCYTAKQFIPFVGSSINNMVITCVVLIPISLVLTSFCRKFLPFVFLKDR